MLLRRLILTTWLLLVVIWRTPEASGQRLEEARTAVAASPLAPTSTFRLANGQWESVERKLVWPWFALGGLVVGGGVVAALVLANCDEGCRDDGGFGIG